jgi:flagellar basal-body rod protein FlgF
MINGLYQSAAGMLTQMNNHQTIAENLSGASTPGYRRNQIAFESFLKASSSPKPTNPTASSPDKGSMLPARIPTTQVGTDYTQGLLVEDSNPHHVALVGPGFFAVELPDNQGIGYTRNGSLHINSLGEIVTNDGWSVQKDGGGPLTVPKPSVGIKINELGEIVQEGSVIGKFQVGHFSDPEAMLNGIGGGLYVVKDPSILPEAVPVETRIVQGSLESSNVNSIQEMIAMMQATRAYEANQKMMQAQDGVLEQIIRIPTSN